MPIRTRFAPSPTGNLHIGGVRTALFNYLFAKKNKGSFILRIEDTDLARNQEKLSLKIYQNLLWLNMKPDESPFDTNGKFGPYSQKERTDLYENWVKYLLNEKKAYYCFCSQEDVEKERKEYIEKNKKGNYQYSRKCFFLPKETIDENIKKNTKFVIRIFINQKDTYDFDDLIRGKIKTKGEDVEDFIVYRMDKTPLYNFAATVDDHLMEITHVIRGEDHITNTSKQVALYRMFGWTPPIFIHIPIILNEEKKKISKRGYKNNKLQYIEELKKKGYLPAAIINYLLFLGWHPGNTKEIFSLEEAIDAFKLENIQTSSAIYDINKLNWYNKQYIKKLSKKEYLELVINKFIPKKSKYSKRKKIRILLLFKEQINCLEQLLDVSSFFFEREKKNTTNKDKKEWMHDLITKLKDLKKWDEKKIEKTLTDVSIIFNKKKEIYSETRKLVSYQEKGPSLISIIYILGKKETLNRLK